MIVERLVPNNSYIIEGLANGKYCFSGGTVRVSGGYAGGGQIVKHFIIPDNSALEQIKQVTVNNSQAFSSIQSLQNANLALGGSNFAVSVAGFAIVINKLNEINRMLSDMGDKIDRLLEGQIQILFHQHIKEQTKLFSNLENLQLALEINDHSLLIQSISRINESRKLYMAICEHIAGNHKALYYDASSFESNVKMVMVSGIAQANALSNQGHIKQAIDLVENVTHWQTEIVDNVMTPVKSSNPPVWLGQLSKESRGTIKRVINEQKCVKQGIHYLTDTYRLCQRYNILPDNLPKPPDGEILLIE